MQAEPTTSLKDLLDRTQRPAARPLRGNAEEEDFDSEYSAFANGRIGNRPQLSVIFRKADGSAKGFNYTHFFCIDSNSPADGFVLDFPPQKVIVRGRNLAHLFRLLCQHKAAEIVEASQALALQASPEAPVVESIEFRRS